MDGWMDGGLLYSGAVCGKAGVFAKVLQKFIKL